MSALQKARKLAVKYRNLSARAVARVASIMEDEAYTQERERRRLYIKEHRLPWEKT